MQRYNGRALTEITSGGVTPVRFSAFATITVYQAGTLTLATLYADEALTPLANPFSASANGQFYFYAVDGKYDIYIVDGSPPVIPYQITNELLDDTLSLSGGVDAGIEMLNALTAASQSFVTGSSGSDFSISSAGSTHTFNLPTATATVRGALSPSDWSSFNAKIGSFNTLTTVIQTLAIGSSGSAPNWSSSGSVHTLHLPFVSATKSGILSAADYTSLSAKEAPLGVGTTQQYLRGDKVWANLNTAVVPESGSNFYYTDVRARAALSGTSPITYNSGTGAVGIQAATGAQPGHLTAADWNTFNSKLGSLNGLTSATQTFATGSTGSDFNIASGGSTHTFHLPAASVSASGKINTSAQSLSGPKTFASALISQGGRRRSVAIHTAPANATMVAINEVLVINKSVAGATTVTLPSGPTTGDEVEIWDGKGDASGNNITIEPASGTINGVASIVINSNYGRKVCIYTGSEWLGA